MAGIDERALARKVSRTTPWWRAFRNLPLYWLHQRLRYMDTSERWFHLALNMLLWVGVFITLLVAGYGKPKWLIAIYSLLISRSINYIFNDNLWVGLMHSFTFVKNPGLARMASYLAASQDRLSRCPSIHAYALYGGIVRNKFHAKSDLDVRYVRSPGFYNAIAANMCAARERVIAVVNRIPLDLNVGDSVAFLDKMRDDEPPVILKDSEGKLAAKYKNISHIDAVLSQLLRR